MPQLDLMHFFSQFFWFSVGFTFLYAYLLHNTIPVIATNLKFRQKKLEILATDINKGKDNVSALLGVYDDLIFTSFQLWKSNITLISKQGDAWVVTNVQALNNSRFRLVNKEYLRAVGEQNFKSIVLKSFVINNKI
jgi:Plant ATP synthase F0